MPRLPMTSALLLVLGTSGSAAFAQASGDGFQGPVVFGDAALNQSLAALNRETQITYARTETISGLVQPSDFASMAVVALDRETSADLAAAPALTVREFEPVSGDTSLDTVLADIGAVHRDREDQLFVTIALAASGTLGSQFEDGDATVTEFGPSISGDATLTAKMGHLLDVIAPQDVDNLQVSVSVQAFDDAALNLYGRALATTPTDL